MKTEGNAYAFIFTFCLGYEGVAGYGCQAMNVCVCGGGHSVWWWCVVVVLVVVVVGNDIADLQEGLRDI